MNMLDLIFYRTLFYDIRQGPFPPPPNEKVSKNALLGYLVIYSIFNFNKDNITIYYHFPSPKVRLLAK